MSTRAGELVEAAMVLSGAGDREGALRLVDEALRLAPGDERALAFKSQLAPPTPFAPPPADLFGGTFRPSNNPFAKPAAPQSAAAPPSPTATPTDAPSGDPGKPPNDLEQLLRGAIGSLQAGPNAGEPSAASGPTLDPFAKAPLASPATTLPFGARPSAPSRPPSSPGASRTGTLIAGDPATPGPRAASGPASARSGTLMAGETPSPSRPASDAGSARSGTLMAGEVSPPPSRPASSPGSARTGTLMAGDSGARPPTRTPAAPASKPARPTSRGKASRPRSDPNAKPPPPPAEALRPTSSAPYDPMDLIDRTPPPSPAKPSRIDEQLRRARELLEFADHSGALDVLDQLLTEVPKNAEALALRARCEATLTSMFESKLGDLNRRPRLKLRPDEVIWLNLDHRAGFVLAQIDGTVSLEDLFDLSGMSRLDTARILAQLVDEKVIAF